jgi:hypothetical protein
MTSYIPEPRGLKVSFYKDALTVEIRHDGKLYLAGVAEVEPTKPGANPGSPRTIHGACVAAAWPIPGKPLVAVFRRGGACWSAPASVANDGSGRFMCKLPASAVKAMRLEETVG